MLALLASACFALFARNPKPVLDDFDFYHPGWLDNRRYRVAFECPGDHGCERREIRIWIHPAVGFAGLGCHHRTGRFAHRKAGALRTICRIRGYVGGCRLCIVFVRGSPKPKTIIKRPERVPFGQMVTTLAHNRTVLGMALAFTVIWITTMGRSPIRNSYMTSLGAHASLIGIANTVSALFEVPFMLLADRLIGFTVPGGSCVFPYWHRQPLFCQWSFSRPFQVFSSCASWQALP